MGKWFISERAYVSKFVLKGNVVSVAKIMALK